MSEPRDYPANPANPFDPPSLSVLAQSDEHFYGFIVPWEWFSRDLGEIRRRYPSRLPILDKSEKDKYFGDFNFDILRDAVFAIEDMWHKGPRVPCKRQVTTGEECNYIIAIACFRGRLTTTRLLKMVLDELTLAPHKIQDIKDKLAEYQITAAPGWYPE